jgi:hypothetical protein
MGHTPGPWKSTFTLRNERGVRAEKGFICFMTKPSHYANQDQRYEDELAQAMYDAKLIAAAPDMLEALQSANKYFVDLQNKCALTSHDERAWKNISKVIKQATDET